VKQKEKGEWSTCNFIRDNNRVIIDPFVNHDSIICIGRKEMLFGRITTVGVVVV
jgi:hypothetical protein